MREPEFLPDWYPRLHRNRRWLAVQGWAAAAVMLALLGYCGKKHWDISRAQRELTAMETSIRSSHGQLEKLDALLEYRKQLKQQQQVLAKLGLDFQATRLMNTLDDAMPAAMAITQLTFETQESVHPTPAALAVAHPTGSPAMDRTLMVRLQGLAASDVEVADLLAKLSAVRFLDNVSMAYSRDRVEAGRAMREFEVTFSLNLNAPPDAQSDSVQTVVTTEDSL